MDSAATLLANFDSRVVALQQTFDDASAAVTAGALKATSRQAVAESLVIQVAADFEQFTADLFYSCALGDSGIAGASSKIPVSTITEVDTLIYSHRRENYLTWLPYSDTLGRAENYLADGIPFTRLKYRHDELKALALAMILRNAVAHASSYALEQFRKVATERSYPSGRPADFLLSTRGTPTELELTLAGFRATARGLCATDEPTADSILAPEHPFSGSTSAPASDYVCLDCGAARDSHPGGKLGACKSCGRGAPCSECGKQQGSTSWRRVI